VSAVGTNVSGFALSTSAESVTGTSVSSAGKIASLSASAALESFGVALSVAVAASSDTKPNSG